MAEEEKKKRATKKSSSSSSSSDKKEKKKRKTRTKPSGIPPAAELEKLFEQLLLNLGVGEDQKKMLRAAPKEQQWTMICQSNQDLDSTTPADFVEMFEKDEIQLKYAEKLRVALAHENMAWIQKFIGLGGVDIFFKKYEQHLGTTSPSKDLINEFTLSAKGLLNAKIGLEAALKCPNSLSNIVLSLPILPPKTKKEAMEILAALCLITIESHRSIYQFVEASFESTILKYLSSKDDLQLVGATVLFVNALLYGIYEARDRIRFRERFGLVERMETLQKLSQNPDYHYVEQNVDAFYEKYLSEPELEDEVDSLSTAATGGFIDRLQKFVEDLKRSRSPVYSKLTGLIDHLMLLKTDGKEGEVSWECIDSFVQSAIAIPASSDSAQYTKAVCKRVVGEQDEEFTKGLENSSEDEIIASLKKNLNTLQSEVETLKARQPEVKVVTVEKEKIVEKIVYRDAPAAADASAPPAPGGPVPPPPPGGIPGIPGAPPPPGGGAPPPPPPGGIPGIPGAPPPPGGGPPPPPGGGPPPPPPGGPGGPPPPPGGPGGPPPLPGAAPRMLGRPKKKQVKPSTKMRGLAWAKIEDRKIDNTIWDKNINDDSVIANDLDLKELESIFCAAVPVATQSEGSGSGGSAKSTSSKPKIITLLDGKRSNNVSIMLSRFGKMSYADIGKAILELDESVLPIENTAALKQLTPEPEEIETMKEFSGDTKLLGKAERFFLEMIKIKALKPRLNALHTKQGFDKKLEVARNAVLVMLDAVKEIKETKKLPKMLELVLAVGNFLNGGTFRGGAYGFKLETLVKMTEVKATDNKTNMLNYLATYCEAKEKYKELLTIQEDFPHVADSCRESIPQAQSDLNKLKGELSQVENAIKSAPNPPGDKFVEIMTDFHSKGLAILEETLGLHAKLEKDYKDLLAYFGENPSTDSQSFFVNLNTFLEAFDKAQKDNVRRKVLAEKQKVAEKRRKEMAERIAAKRAASGASAPADEEGGAAPKKLRSTNNRNMLDNLIADMRTGQAFAPPQPNQMANEALAVFARLKKTRNAPLP